MLVSSMGFAVNTHYCSGKAVDMDFSIGLHNLDCGMNALSESCKNTSGNITVQAEPCCENQHELLQIDNTLEVQPAFVSMLVPFFVQETVHSVEISTTVEATQKIQSTYLPPTFDKDIQVFYQVFIV